MSWMLYKGYFMFQQYFLTNIHLMESRTQNRVEIKWNFFHIRYLEYNLRKMK